MFHAKIDLGVSSNFLVNALSAVTMQKAEYPIVIKLPYGSIIWLIHTCKLDIICLPYEIAEAHPVTRSQHSCLISAK